MPEQRARLRYLVTRRIPTVLRMWLLIEFAQRLALDNARRGRRHMAAHFQAKADRWRRLTAPRPEWWTQYF